MAYFGSTLQSKIAALLAEYPDADASTSSAQIVADGGQFTSIKLNMNTSVGEDVGEDDVQTTTSVNVEAEIDDIPVSADATATGETASASVEVSAEEGSGIEVITESEATGDIGDVVTAETTVSPEFGIVEQEKVETSDDNSLTAESYTYANFDPNLFDEATLNESLALDPSLPLEGSAVILEENPMTFEETASASGDWLLG